MAVIALDLGGTKLSGAIFNHKAHILFEKTEFLKNRKGPEVGKLICSMVLEMSGIAEREKMELTALGISVPGISHRDEGTVWAPNIEGWDNYPLYEELKSAVEDQEFRIVIDSDRACSILGEVWNGAARDAKNAIFLAVGTGIGAGILVDGKVLRGSDNIAGAVGWLALNRPYLDKYKRQGCFEYYASGTGLVQVAMEILREEKNYNGPLQKKDPRGLSAQDLFEAYSKEDPVARKVFSIAIGFWGMAIANLVSLFNPEKIILGGGVFGPGLQFVDQIREEAAQWAQPIGIHQVSLQGSLLGGRAALYGAGYLAIKT